MTHPLNHTYNTVPYRPDTEIPAQTIDVVFNAGGLGDNIARLPALKYFLYHNPHIIVRVWVPDYFIGIMSTFKSTLHPINHTLHIHPIGNYTSHLEVYGLASHTIDFKHPHHTATATNLTTHAFNVLVNKEVGIGWHEYPLLYAATHTPIETVCIGVNAVSPTRQWDTTTLHTLIDYLLDKKKTVLLLGKDVVHISSNRMVETMSVDIHIKHPHLIDLRNKTLLDTAAQLIASSECMIGMDGGLIHLAALTPTPIVCGYSTVAPQHRYLHNRKVYEVTPDLTLECRHCQSHMGFLPKHKFSTCLYGDSKCIGQLTADKFIQGYNMVRQHKSKVVDVYDRW